jgi:hypothetical protein
VYGGWAEVHSVLSKECLLQTDLKIVWWKHLPQKNCKELSFTWYADHFQQLQPRILNGQNANLYCRPTDVYTKIFLIAGVVVQVVESLPNKGTWVQSPVQTKKKQKNPQGPGSIWQRGSNCRIIQGYVQV